MEYLLAVSKNSAHPLHPVYNDGNNGGVQWWEKRCNSTSVRSQVAWMGADAYTMEEFWMKYGHPQLLDREALFRFFFWMKHTLPVETGVWRRLGVRALPMFANILTMLYKKFAGLTG